MAKSSKKRERKSKTQNFYDRIADVHHIALRVNGYRKSVAKYLKSINLEINADSFILDAGSGTGIVTSGFYSAGFRPRRMVAFDLSYNSLKVSREQFRKDKRTDDKTISGVQGNILQLPFADESFDLVLTCGVLEYVPVEDGLREMARVLKKGSRLVLIPVRPSIIGSVLEILYNFKTHPVREVRKASRKYFNLVGYYKFPFTEPMGWSKMIFLLERK